MSKVRFPKKWADGSFCVEVTLAIQTDDPEGLLKRAQAWLVQWAKDNQVWIWKFDTGGQEELLYQREFKREPLPVSCTPTELKIQLEGQPTAERWKDWLVFRIVRELKEVFIEIQDVSSVKNCE